MPVTLPPHKTGTVKSQDVEIFYRAFGKPGKTPVVILHGLSYFSYDWIDIADALADNREVVAIDMRGFGNSSWSPSKSYKVQNFSADILAVMDKFGWKQAVLIGHSMGGRNCTYTASAHPDRVAKLVLVDFSPTNAKAGSQRVTNTIVDMKLPFKSLDEAMSYFKVDPKNATDKQRARFEAYLMPHEGGLIPRRDLFFKENFRRIRDEGMKPDHGADLWECLGKVQCPTLVLRGRSSDMFAPETVDKVRSTNKNITLVEVDGGHNIPGENPEGLKQAVKKFLD
ncbi:MAG TPA: alpha/beta hydrolase [Alphaproteobacteria bacterium]|jgi:pimeloyl-ACP methyl ester carboxylesterase|nr:alpha/beta hydrolase [Alphaproteobacteria bacterium]